MEWEATEPALDEYYDAACQAEYDRLSNERSRMNEGCPDDNSPVAICPAAGG